MVGPWSYYDIGDTFRGRWGGFGNTYTPPTSTTTRRTGVVTAKALGRVKPAVIGTGKVEGIPVYGELAAVTTLEVDDPGWAWWWGPKPEPTEPKTVVTVDVAYLLSHDYFGRGYSLIRIEADGDCVYDAENGVPPKCEFRFLNGLQETVDPFFTRIVGANAGAHKGDVILVLNKYPAQQAPVITCVISNAATTSGGDAPIAWVGPTPFNLNWLPGQGYDHIDGLIYQCLSDDEISTSVVYLSVLDVDLNTEIRRVPLEDSADYMGNEFIVALPGSGLALVRLAINPGGDIVRIYDTITGHIKASFVEDANEASTFVIPVPFEDKWLLFGGDIDNAAGQQKMYAVVDPVAGTFEVTRTAAVSGFLSISSAGRVLDGSSSAFFSDSATVTEVTWDGDSWSTRTAYTAVGTILAIHYDPQSEYLVVVESVSGNVVVQMVRPDTAQINTQFASDRPLFPMTFFAGERRGFPRPGFALFRTSTQRVYAISVAELTMTHIIDVDAEIPGVEANWVFVDHGRLAVLNAYGDTKWTKLQIPGTVPGQITLRSHIEDLLTYLGAYEIEELTFEGFTGVASWGDVVDSDTTIRTILRTYQEAIGFTWSDIGTGLYFRKVATDGSFSADAAIADTDLVFKEGGSIRSNDTSDLSRVAKVTLEYVSKENNYEVQSRSADSFSGLYEVTRSLREEEIATRLIMSDTYAEQLVHEILWRMQGSERSHQFSAFADFAAKLIPGDIVTVPSGGIEYTVQIMKANIQANLRVDYDARDFQTSLSADVAAVTNNGYNGINPVTLQSQYIHLDIPLFRYADDADGEKLIQYGVMASRGSANWRGGYLFRGDTASELAFVIDQAPHVGFIGVCTTVLADNPTPFAGDFANSVTVVKVVGTVPENATEENVYLGTNLAFVGRNGRWEGVGFMTVETGEVGGTYVISDFAVRGYRGTEVYSGTHALGDLFVLIKPEWLLKMSHPVTDLDVSKFYKAVGISAPKSTGTLVSGVIAGAAETPYAVVNAEAELSGGDTLITWDYRSRLAAWEMFDVLPDCGEATLAFEVDIVDTGSPASVIRTITVTTNAATYTAAQKTTDFGGSPPVEITAIIYMMSASVGRGHACQLTIPL